MSLLDHYNSFQKNLPAAARPEAFNFFKSQGLPSRHLEDWKYTSLKALDEKDFLPATSSRLDESHKTLIRAQLPKYFEL
jgi:hypothetical protein